MSPQDRQYQHQGGRPENSGRCFWQNVILADLVYLLSLVDFFVFKSFCHLKAVVIDVSGFTLKSGQCEMFALELRRTFYLFVGVVSLLSSILRILNGIKDILKIVNIKPLKPSNF